MLRVAHSSPVLRRVGLHELCDFPIRSTAPKCDKVTNVVPDFLLAGCQKQRAETLFPIMGNAPSTVASSRPRCLSPLPLNSATLLHPEFRPRKTLLSLSNLPSLSKAMFLPFSVRLY